MDDMHFTSTVRLKPQADMTRDPELAARTAREAEERERKGQQEREAREARRKEAERIVPDNLAYAVVAPAMARGENINTLLAACSPEVKALLDRIAKLTQEIESLEAKRDAETSNRLSPYALGKLADDLQPCHEERAPLLKLLETCHQVAKERIAKSVGAIIAEQIRLRDQFIAKAVPFDERVGLAEQLLRYWGAPAYGTQKRNLKRWVQEG